MEPSLSADEYRTHFERLINHGGVDITTGGALWDQYRSFELDEYEDTAEALAEAELEEETGNGVSDLQVLKDELQQAKARVIKLFHRQLALPLVGNQKVLLAFEVWLESNCVASDEALINPIALTQKYSLAAAALEERLPFEMHLLSDAYELDSAENKAASWFSYIRFELAALDMSRARRLFERSLGINMGINTVSNSSSDSNSRNTAQTPCSEVPLLWAEYVRFARHVVKDWSLVSVVTAQCRHLFPTDISFWKSRLAALELTGATAESMKEELVYISTHCAFLDVHHYLYVYQYGCDFFKRRLYTHLLVTASGGVGVYPEAAADRGRDRGGDEGEAKGKADQLTEPDIAE